MKLQTNILGILFALITQIACTPASPPAIDGEAAICKMTDYIHPYIVYDYDVVYEGQTRTFHSDLILLCYNTGYFNPNRSDVNNITLLVHLKNKDSLILHKDDIFENKKPNALSDFLKKNKVVYKNPQLLGNLVMEGYGFRGKTFDSLQMRNKVIQTLYQKREEVSCSYYLFQKTLTYITTSPSNTLFQVYKDNTHFDYTGIILEDTNICSNIIVLKVPQNDIMNFELVKIR